MVIRASWNVEFTQLCSWREDIKQVTALTNDVVGYILPFGWFFGQFLWVHQNDHHPVTRLPRANHIPYRIIPDIRTVGRFNAYPARPLPINLRPGFSVTDFRRKYDRFEI
jgi:hypothetical protein